MTKLKVLKIFLMVVILSGCSEKYLNLPYKEPVGSYFQPIIDQEFCENEVCERKTVCREYVLNEKKEFKLVKTHDIKMCHGIIGVNSDFYQSIRKWLRDTYIWMQEKCEFRSNK